MTDKPWTAYLSSTSPYARKVRVLVAERAMQPLVQETYVLPFENPPELLAHGGVGKIPLLVGRGPVLFDSRVICEFLDSISPGPTTLSGEALWADRVRVALGDAIMDAAAAIVLERRRNDSEQSQWWIDRQIERLHRIVSAAIPGTNGEPTLGDQSVACALAYLDFRLPELSWQDDNTALAHWHQSIEARESFRRCPLK